ncbi:hypothetical protein AB3S75_014416 [Citrus x aurantiifolia]
MPSAHAGTSHATSRAMSTATLLLHNAAQFERFRHGGYGCEYLPRSIESGCKEARVSGGFMRKEFGVRMGRNLNT